MAAEKNTIVTTHADGSQTTEVVDWTEEQLSLADINGDGTIDVGDIIALINIILSDSRTTSVERGELEYQLSRLDGLQPKLSRQQLQSMSVEQLQETKKQRGSTSTENPPASKIIKAETENSTLEKQSGSTPEENTPAPKIIKTTIIE